MALRVHALLVSEVISLLQRVSRYLAGAGSGERTDREAGTRTRRRAAPAADRGARRCANQGTDRGACHAAVDRSLIWVSASNLLVGELPAFEIICAKRIETFARTGQDHDARAAGNGCAAAEKQ
jgi:hypothetical protein